MFLPNRSAGQKQYLATDSTQGSFSLTAGRTSDFALLRGGPEGMSTLVKNANANHRVVLMNRPWRGVKISFNGSAAQNLTIDYKLWVVNFAHVDPHLEGSDINQVPMEGEIQVWAYGTITTGNLQITAEPSRVKKNNYLADTVTLIVASDATATKGLGQTTIDAYQLGQTTVYSPADDTVGQLIVPDFGSGCSGWILEFDLTGAAGVNAVFEKTM